jgi:hypothetical protein
MRDPEGRAENRGEVEGRRVESVVGVFERARRRVASDLDEVDEAGRGSRGVFSIDRVVEKGDAEHGEVDADGGEGEEGGSDLVSVRLSFCERSV